MKKILLLSAVVLSLSACSSIDYNKDTYEKHECMVDAKAYLNGDSVDSDKASNLKELMAVAVAKQSLAEACEEDCDELYSNFKDAKDALCSVTEGL